MLSIPPQLINKYIQTEQVSATPSDYAQEISPSYGKFINKVTLDKAPLKTILCGVSTFSFKLEAPKLVNASRNNPCGYCGSGAKHDNVYVSREENINKSFVYLVPVGSDLSSNLVFEIVDFTNKTLKQDIIIMRAGDRVTSTASTYSPGGILEYTLNGRLTFLHNSVWRVGAGSSYCTFYLLINGIYYIPMVDYTLWDHDYDGAGSRSSSGTGVENNSIQPIAVSKNNFYKPKVEMSNITNVYFYFRYHRSDSWDPTRMTFNYGLNVPIIVEDNNE